MNVIERTKNHAASLKEWADAKVIGLFALAAVSAPAAMAQATDPFTQAVDEITAKVESYGLSLVGLSAVGVVFMIAMKYVKKLRGAA